jgi:orotidine-5'-phosphate decarboxylase
VTLRSAKDCIALAVDLPLPGALSLYERLRAHVGVVKVGLSLFVEHGPAAVLEFQARGARVFLDLKLHDIPNTVELAAAKAAALGVAYLTVHALGGSAMLCAALAGAAEGAGRCGHPPPIVLAVTVLTSMDQVALEQVGIHHPPHTQVARLVGLAHRAGVGGIVCSAQEVGAVRAIAGEGMTLCTPGIRPLGAAHGDQARVETPGAAIRAGSTLLVVGRPITESADPLDAAVRLEAEVAAALG